MHDTTVESSVKAVVQHWRHDMVTLREHVSADGWRCLQFGTFKKAELPSGKGYLRTTADPSK